MKKQQTTSISVLKTCVQTKEGQLGHLKLGDTPETKHPEVSIQTMQTSISTYKMSLYLEHHLSHSSCSPSLTSYSSLSQSLASQISPPLNGFRLRSFHVLELHHLLLQEKSGNNTLIIHFSRFQSLF